MKKSIKNILGFIKGLTTLVGAAFTVAPFLIFLGVNMEIEFKHHGVKGQQWGVITRNVGKYYIPKNKRYSDYNDSSTRERMNDIHGSYAKGDIREPRKKILGPKVERLSDLKKRDGSISLEHSRYLINHPSDGVSKKGQRSYNCQNCAVAFDMVERGYDVVARPKDKASNVGDIQDFYINGEFKSGALKSIPANVSKLYKKVMDADAAGEGAKADAYYDIFKKKYDELVQGSVDRTLNMIRNDGKKSRGILVIGWAMNFDADPEIRTRSYHAINYTCRDGKVKIYDAQDNRASMRNGRTDIQKMLQGADAREIYYMRTDNLEPNENVTKAVYSRRDRDDTD